MKTVTIGKEQGKGEIFHIPDSWNQLTSDQLLRIAGLSLQQITPSDFKLKALLSITGLRLVEKREVMVDGIPHFYLRTPGKNVFLFNLEELGSLCDLLDFLFERVEKKVPGKGKTEVFEEWLISSRLIRNIIGPIKVGDAVWHGPADALSNITTGEFIRAETSLSLFFKTGTMSYLHKLVAALWRPAADQPSSTDIREPFDDGLVDVRAKDVRKVPEAVQQSIVLFYTGCRKAISAKFTYASEGKGSKTADGDVLMEFMRMVNGLAQNDVTKHDAVRKAYLMETMITIDELARQAKELEARLKKKR